MDQNEQEFYAFLEKAMIPKLDPFTTSNKVIEALLRRIGGQSLDIQVVADELHLSKRTMQRRLHSEGTDYRKLRDHVRHNKSIEYLLESECEIGKICVLLDYTDRTSFNNAFKRWTQMSPRDFRIKFQGMTIV